MKTRAIVLVDYEIKGGMIEGADEQKALRAAIEAYAANTPTIVGVHVDMKDRRGASLSEIDMSSTTIKLNFQKEK